MDTNQPPVYKPSPEQMQPATMGMQPMMVQPGYQPVAGQTSTSAVTVVQPGPATHIYVDSKPESYLVFSILTMLFCCFICGLIALIYSLQVDSAWNGGDQEGAKRSAQTAKKWNIAALVSGIITIVVTIVGSVIIGVVVPLAAAASITAATANTINTCYDSTGRYIC